MYGNGKNEQKNSAALGGGERSCGADLGDVIVGAAEARHDLAAEELPRRPCHAEERATTVECSVRLGEVRRRNGNLRRQIYR